jgi:anti-sigma regulatory factor (Ser/Thr protein kinase)
MPVLISVSRSLLRVSVPGFSPTPILRSARLRAPGRVAPFSRTCEDSAVPKLSVPNSATIHNARAFLEANDPFQDRAKTALLELHPRWLHVEPMALVMIAAWGAWCQRNGYKIRVKNQGPHAAYMARMKLFEHLGVPYDARPVTEREEAGRFLPVTQVTQSQQVPGVIGNISALLHLQEDPESLSAVQYCVSELLRNVLEHSGSPDGAFVAAHRYTKKGPHRVTIAVADCGRGIADHLGQVHPEALSDDRVALGLAMRPGITGARAGVYGVPDNAGAGLFITRCMAKGTGGYFLLSSGDAAYRLRRSTRDVEMAKLYIDGYDDPGHDDWTLEAPWRGTIVSVEIRTEKIGDYNGFFRWIFNQIPRREPHRARIKFT